MKGILKDQKQKFINIIEEIQDCGAIGDGGMLYKACNNKQLAETLIANNAIVLPAKLGSKVFAIATPCGGCEKASFDEDGIKECKECEKKYIEEMKFSLDLADMWGEYVFATRAEAEERCKKNEEV